jgi:hypothetical protein
MVVIRLELQKEYLISLKSCLGLAVFACGGVERVAGVGKVLLEERIVTDTTSLTWDLP